MKYFCLALASLCLLNVYAYSTDELSAYKSKYPNENAVILNHDQKVKIEINKKTGELEIYRTDYEEVLYLNETAKYYTSRYISISEYFQDIVDVKVVVYNPKGKKFTLKSEDFKIVDSTPSSWIFHDDDKEMVFDLKELGEGYRTVITYTKKLKQPEFFGVFQLMGNYIIENGTVEMTYPESTKIAFTEMNLERYSASHSETVEKGNTTKIWQIKDVEAYKNERGSINIRYYLPQIVAQIQSYQKNGETVELIQNPDDLHQFFYDFLMAKGNEKDRGELNRTVREITEGMETELEKMDTVFKWVQSNIKYIAFEDGVNGFVPRSCSKVMKDRYGDCKDMGNLLVEMLTYAGVNNAHVAWVGTRDIPYLMSEIPSPLTCNHVICVVDKPGGDYYYLDATSSEVSYLYPPNNIQGKEILVHYDENNYKLHKVKPTPISLNHYLSSVTFTFNDTDSLFATGVDMYHGYLREKITYRLKNYEQEDLDEYIKDICVNGYSKYTIKDYNIENLAENNLPLHIHYDFSFKNSVIKDGEDLIFNPDLFDLGGILYSKDEFKQTRHRSYHKQSKYIYTVIVPDGYKVKFLPEDIHFEHELMNFTATFKQEGNKIVVTKIYAYELLEIPPSLFDDWNEFSKAINLAAMQNIIFTQQN